jgi:hypothetical protein
MMRHQININKFKRPTKEQYFFIVLCVNHIVHELVVAHIYSETQDVLPFFVEYGCLLPSLELYLAVPDLLSETDYLQYLTGNESGSGFDYDIKPSVP